MTMSSEIFQENPYSQEKYSFIPAQPIDVLIGGLEVDEKNRSEFLNKEFLRVAKQNINNPSYIMAREFNVAIMPRIRRPIIIQTMLSIGRVIENNPSLYLTHQTEKISVYGVPDAGVSFAGALADYINLPLHLTKKNAPIPGSWLDILSINTHSYTSNGKPAELHFDSVSKGDKVILVDDALATGKTLVDTINGFRNRGATVIGVTVAFSKLFESGLDTIENMGIPVSSPVQIIRADEEGIVLANFRQIEKSRSSYNRLHRKMDNTPRKYSPQLV